MKAAIDRYKVFENLNVVVDLGGGIGTALKIIISKYPKIKGINFNLPHVIQNVSPIPGVEHVGGNIFGSIPKADAIFMKNILHLWKDEQCIAILKNCFDALPDNGKVIVLDMVRPEIPEPKAVLRGVYFLDIVMMINGGNERTEAEFKNLAKIAGFSGIKVMCLDYKHFLIEFYKNQ